MIMPGVQKPHWRPCWSQNACWRGWRVAPSAMPSIVLTSAPSAWTASIVQDFALSPLTWTVHAPQLLVSQPMWVPGQAEDVAEEVDEQEPRLDVGLAGLAVDGDRDVLMSRSSRPPLRERAGALDGGAERPDGHLGDHRPLVVDGAADVRGGLALGGRGVAGAAIQAPRWVPGRRRAASALVAANGLGETPVTPMPMRPIVPSSASRTTTATPTVAKSPTRRSSLRSRRRRPSARRGIRISVRTSVGSIAVVNVSRKKSRALIARSPPLPRHDDRRVRSEQRGRPVGGRIGVGDGAADRAPVADLRVADAARHVLDERVRSRTIGFSLIWRCVARAPIRRSSSVSDDAVEPADGLEVDEDARPGRAGASAAGSGCSRRRGASPRPLARRGSGSPRRGSAGRTYSNGSRNHARPSSSTPDTWRVGPRVSSGHRR